MLGFAEQTSSVIVNDINDTSQLQKAENYGYKQKQENNSCRGAGGQRPKTAVD